MSSTFDTEIEVTITRNDFPVSAVEKEGAPCILIVDDDKINRLVVISVLQGRGYSMEVAENGKEAVYRWENNSFDLILMDIHMPLINGIEATWIIRSHETDRGDYTPIIACSADYTMEYPDELSCLGFDGFVRKPLVFETLLREIHRCIRLKRVGPA